MVSSNPFIYDTDKPTKFVPPISISLHDAMFRVSAQLRWQHAHAECLLDGRDYTEIHFWRNPETEELVLTYWEITP